MKVAWAVAAAAIVSVPILALPTHRAAPVEADAPPSAISHTGRKAGLAIVVHGPEERVASIDLDR